MKYDVDSYKTFKSA